MIGFNGLIFILNTLANVLKICIDVLTITWELIKNRDDNLYFKKNRDDNRDFKKNRDDNRDFKKKTGETT